MAEFTPTIIPLGSLAEAAAASAEVSYQEQLQPNAIIGPTTGIIAPAPDWP
jgi:hypothetical protein